MIRAMLKRVFLTTCAILGLFAIARRLTRGRLRILCYHGFSIGDQHQFSPGLYMRPETFERHLDLIVRKGFRVVSLTDGLAMLRAHAVRHGETVITIDDGWKTTFTLAAGRLRKAQLPASVYVTSYYVDKPVAVFNVAVRYMFWRCAGQVIDVRGIGPQIDGILDLREPHETTIERWIAFADSALNWQQRQELLGKLAMALGLDIDEVLAEGRFASVNEKEIAELVHQGIDVQLHTHRHRLPATDFVEVKREIGDNRTVLEAITRAPCDHFCYPSGIYAQNHPAWLNSLGVVSATTCEPGLNDSGTDTYLLRRYLARDDAPDIELLAELSGFAEILRWCRQQLRSITRRVPRDPKLNGHVVRA